MIEGEGYEQPQLSENSLEDQNIVADELPEIEDVELNIRAVP